MIWYEHSFFFQSGEALFGRLDDLIFPPDDDFDSKPEKKVNDFCFPSSSTLVV
jgi:hypothetical protein